MQRALEKEGMPKKAARKEAASRLEARRAAKKRKLAAKKLKDRIKMEMLWEDRENRIFDRREFEPRIVQKGWERQRIMRGTVLGTMAKKHLKVYKPTLDIPERPIEALAEDENGGGGATLKDGTMLADASKSLSTFMPLYLESIRIHRVTKVSTGFGHTLLCTDMGACLSFGRGMDGQLGHGRNANNFTPTVIDSLREVFVIDVGAGLSHSCVISRPSDRFIFCMGLNTIGQCGQGNNSLTRINKPSLVSKGRQIYPVCVSVGSMHSAVLSEDGTVWSWGDNSYGQLGHGLVPDRTVVRTVKNSDRKFEPKKILAMRFALVSHVALGAHHTAMITETGDLFTCGRNNRGQLGLGDLEDRATPVCVAVLTKYQVSDVACGSEHTVVCMENGSVFGMGNNRFSQLGLQDEEALSVLSPSLNRKNRKKGKGRFKKRKASPRSPRPSKVLFSTPQRIDGGDFKAGNGTKIWRVAAGSKHSVFVSKSGKMYGCGESGYNGRMGHMTNERQEVPRHVKYLKSRMLKENKQWMSDFLDTFNGMATKDPTLERKCTPVYELMNKDQLFKISGNRVEDLFALKFQKLAPDCKFEARKIELRRCFNREDVSMKGKMNALGLAIALKRAHIFAMDWTIDKMVIALYNIPTAQVNLEEFIDYVDENWRTRLLSDGFFHRAWEQVFCKPPVDLMNDETGDMFLEVFKECLKDEGILETKDLFYHMRDDGRNDPRVLKGKIDAKKGKGGKNRLWRKGILDLKRCDLTDPHLRALCEALRRFPCIRSVDLRYNFLSTETTDNILQLLKDQYESCTETDYHTSRCRNCHEDVQFRKRDGFAAMCLMCGTKAYRPIYNLIKVSIKEKNPTAESMLKWYVVDCDEDLTTKLITAMKTHEPMSVPKFKRFCAKVLNSHVSKWEKKMDAEFEERTKKMRKKSNARVTSEKLHKFRKERLFNSFRRFITNKTKGHYLRIYRTQASYELQEIMKSTVKQMGADTERSFEPIYPTTTENILKITQQLHHESKERIRNTKWHVPRLMKMLYEIVFKGARDLYRHYASLNLDNLPFQVEAGDTYTTVAMQSGRVMTFGNQDDIQSGFRDEIMQNLPKKFRRMIEKQRKKNIRKETRKLQMAKRNSFQPKEGFTLPKRDSALHGVTFSDSDEEAGPESPVRHSPTRKRLDSMTDHDIPAFFETNECHFHGDGHRSAGSTLARDVAHDATDLLNTHRRLSLIEHSAHMEKEEGADLSSDDDEHNAYSSDSSYSSYSSYGSSSGEGTNVAESVSSYSESVSRSNASYSSTSYVGTKKESKGGGGNQEEEEEDETKEPGSLVPVPVP